MCAVSMVMDWGNDEFKKYIQPQSPMPQSPPPFPWSDESARIAELERKVAEFERLLKRAKQYDEDNDQPDCELEDKKQALRKLAEQLGVEIHFP